MRKTLLLLCLVIALINVGCAFASSIYWRDDFTTDNFKTTGDKSADYWLITISNSNVTKTISNGILQLSHSRSTGSAEQSWLAERLVSASSIKTTEIRFMLPSSPHANFSLLFGVMKDSTTWVFNVEVTSNIIQLGNTNSTGFHWNTLTSTQINTWYTLTVTIDSNALKVNLNGQKFTFDSSYGYADCMDYQLKTLLKAGTTSASGTVYIDYIEWGTASDPAISMTFVLIPVILTFCMLGIALGMIKKLS